MTTTTIYGDLTSILNSLPYGSPTEDVTTIAQALQLDLDDPELVDYLDEQALTTAREILANAEADVRAAGYQVLGNGMVICKVDPESPHAKHITEPLEDILARYLEAVNNLF